MITALANIVTKGNSATQSLSDAFASANHEFGMADRLIGGYQVTDLEFGSEKVEEEEEETTMEVKVLKVKPANQLDHKQIMGDVNGKNANGGAYQLSLLSHIQPVAQEVKNGRANGYKNGHYKNGHHQNRNSNGHANKNGHVQKKGDERNRLISPPQLEMGLLIPNQVRSNKGKSSKRRRKAHRGPSLFDWLQTQERK